MQFPINEIFVAQNSIDSIGFLYNWYAVTNVYGIFPFGFRLPTYNDMITLINYVYTSGVKDLKSTRIGPLVTPAWKTDDSAYRGTNLVGFNALPGGYRAADNGEFYNIDERCYFWLSNEVDSSQAKSCKLLYNSNALFLENNNKKIGMSVRGIMNNPSSWYEGMTVQDYDGNTYDTVKIDTQVWMKQNLVAKRYNNGYRIDYYLDYPSRNVKWTETTSGGYGKYTGYEFTTQSYATPVVTGDICQNSPEFIEYNLPYIPVRGVVNTGPEGITLPGTNLAFCEFKIVLGGETTYYQSELISINSTNGTGYDDYPQLKDKAEPITPSSTIQYRGGFKSGNVYFWGDWRGPYLTFRPSYIGYLYSGYIVDDDREIAPPGCRVPSFNDMVTLRQYLDDDIGSDEYVFAGSNMWHVYNDNRLSINRTTYNKSGFSTLPGGTINTVSGYQLTRSYATYWTTTQFGLNSLWLLTLKFTYKYPLGFEQLDCDNELNSVSDKSTGNSIKCLLNDTGTWYPGMTVTDYDGNVYNTYRLGGQVWLVQPLMVTHFQNGDPLVFRDPTSPGGVGWTADTTRQYTYPVDTVNSIYYSPDNPLSWW